MNFDGFDSLWSTHMSVDVKKKKKLARARACALIQLSIMVNLNNNDIVNDRLKYLFFTKYYIFLIDFFVIKAK